MGLGHGPVAQAAVIGMLLLPTCQQEVCGSSQKWVKIACFSESISPELCPCALKQHISLVLQTSEGEGVSFSLCWLSTWSCATVSRLQTLCFMGNPRKKQIGCETETVSREATVAFSDWKLKGIFQTCLGSWTTCKRHFQSNVTYRQMRRLIFVSPLNIQLCWIFLIGSGSFIHVVLMLIGSCPWQRWWSRWILRSTWAAMLLGWSPAPSDSS